MKAACVVIALALVSACSALIPQAVQLNLDWATRHGLTCRYSGDVPTEGPQWSCDDGADRAFVFDGDGRGIRDLQAQFRHGYGEQVDQASALQYFNDVVLPAPANIPNETDLANWLAAHPTGGHAAFPGVSVNYILEYGFATISFVYEQPL